MNWPRQVVNPHVPSTGGIVKEINQGITVPWYHIAQASSKAVLSFATNIFLRYESLPRSCLYVTLMPSRPLMQFPMHYYRANTKVHGLHRPKVLTEP